jgi:hypothetical protein
MCGLATIIQTTFGVRYVRHATIIQTTFGVRYVRHATIIQTTIGVITPIIRDLMTSRTHTIRLARKKMDVNEHERLSNLNLRHKLIKVKKPCFYCRTIFYSHSRVFNNEHEKSLKIPKEHHRLLFPVSGLVQKKHVFIIS